MLERPQVNSAGDNPFATLPGRPPAVLAGRDTVLAEFARALEQGPNHRHFFSYLVGARGYGKTVMLQEVQGQAERAEWQVLPFDAATGRLYERFHEYLWETVLGKAQKSGRLRQMLPDHITVGLPPLGSASWDRHRRNAAVPGTDGERLSVRRCLEVLADETLERGAGVLVSIDELHDAHPDELRRIGNDIQLVQGGNLNRWISFVGAGLPDMVEPGGLLEEVSTFLHRGRRITIGALADDEARASLEGGYRRAGVTVPSDVLADGVAAASGHPWYLQLVGHHIVAAARLAAVSHVDRAVSDAGIAAAHLEAGPMLFAPVWYRLSNNDRLMVAAIAAEGGVCVAARVRERLGWSSQLVNQYRKRLEARSWVRSERRGELELAHPQAVTWVRQELELSAGSAPGEGHPLPIELANTPDVRATHFALVDALPTTKRRCGAYGPIAKAYCIRPVGHQGQHRYR